MPRNRTTSDSRKPIIEEMDCEEIKMTSQEICISFLKRKYRKKQFSLVFMSHFWEFYV